MLSNHGTYLNLILNFQPSLSLDRQLICDISFQSTTYQDKLHCESEPKAGLLHKEMQIIISSKTDQNSVSPMVVISLLQNISRYFIEWLLFTKHAKMLLC